MTEQTKTFVQYSRAWYGVDQIEKRCKKEHHFVDDICIRDTEADEGEIVVEWYQLVGGKSPSPQLKAFDDGWGFLLTHVDLMSVILTHPGIQPDQLCELLKEHGFVDTTETERTTA